MTLDELFKTKGELIWTIEVAQAKLQEINKQIFELLSTSSSIKDKK